MHYLAIACHRFLSVEVTIDVYNDSKFGADITDYKTNGTYTEQPPFLGTTFAKTNIYVSIEAPLTVNDACMVVSMTIKIV